MKRFSIVFVLAVVSVSVSCKLKPKKHSVDLKSGVAIEKYIPQLDPELNENSGIIYWNKLLWTFNDSGGKNELYGIDAKTGEMKRKIHLTNATNVDWEDIAQNDKYIFIAETGNNAGTRIDLQILRLKKSEISKKEVQHLKVEKIFFSFADQDRFEPFFRHNSYDCEALLEWNDSLYVFTKDWVNFKTKLYAMPNVPGSYNLMPSDSFDVKGLVTGVDINSKGEIAMVGYQNYKSFVWLFDKVKSNFFANPRFVDLSFLHNAQTEGICFTPKGNLLISCEQTTDYPQEIWKIDRKSID